MGYNSDTYTNEQPLADREKVLASDRLQREQITGPLQGRPDRVCEIKLQAGSDTVRRLL
jgi:hypothetical protein